MRNQTQRRADLEQRFEERRRIGTWATREEIEAADRKVEKAQTNHQEPAGRRATAA